MTTPARIVAVSTDLMDRSKLTAGLPGVEIVRPGPDLADRLVGADVIVVDLALPGALADAVTTNARVLAYGSHVDDETLATARGAGAEAMPRSVFFRRIREGGLLD